MLLGDKSKTCQDLLSLNLRYINCCRLTKAFPKALGNANVPCKKFSSLHVTLQLQFTPRSVHDLRFLICKSLTESFRNEALSRGECLFHPASTSVEHIGVSCSTSRRRTDQTGVKSLSRSDWGQEIRLGSDWGGQWREDHKNRKCFAPNYQKWK